MKKTFLILIALLIQIINHSCSQKKSQNMINNKFDDLYKNVIKFESQPEYWIFVHSNNCSYVVTLNNMPVYTDLNDGSMKSLSFPLNPLILSTGAYNLKVRLLPKQDDNFIMNAFIANGSSVSIKISKTVNKKEEIVFNEKISITNEKEPFIEKNYIINLNVPYTLKGWSNGINLENEDNYKLSKEVEEFYLNVMDLYQTKNINKISELYYNRQFEIGQSLYSSNEKDTAKLIDDLNRDINREQDFTLKDYKMQLYGNGKVVGLIRTDGEFFGKSAFLGLTEEDFYIYPLLLFRPKAGAQLEVIR
jgi:hypothetical protein